MSKKTFQLGLLTIILIGLFFLLFRHTETNVAQNPTTKKIVANLPAIIKIKSIKVDAPIESVKVAPDGSMDVPKVAMDTAWYQLGPRPGEIGSAVIDGHVDWKDGSKAVFGDLHKLNPGDKIEIDDDKGKATSFIVTFIRTYKANDSAQDIFISNDGKSHLNLITCSGLWQKAANTYSQRLVIFTTKE
ncbi:MAG: hypothetical protein NVSMB66_3870 [Candidatus Doudnabacteria bacterium]